ncbi:MAG: TIR domain-containing protein [Clostridia bacterium]
MSHDVFISYSHKDLMMATRLCNLLEADRIRCWMAPRDIPPGGSWAAEIAAAIPRSRVMLLIFSTSSNESRQVLREVEMSINNDIILIPLRVGDTAPTGSMSYFLSTTHWIDVPGRDIDGIYPLVSSRIRSILGIGEEEAAQGHARRQPDPQDGVRPRRRRGKVLAIIAGALAALAAGTALFLALDGPKWLEGAIATDTPAPSYAPLQTINPGQREPEHMEQENNLHTPEDHGLNPAKVVDIPDGTLRAAILQVLEDMGHTVSGEITVRDMYMLEELAIVPTYVAQDNRIDGSGYRHVVMTDTGVLDLGGIQYARNLRKLYLGHAELSDIGPLGDLTDLTELILGDNPALQDITALRNLENLVSLHLPGCPITDLSPLAGLPLLEFLDLAWNPVLSDVSALAGSESLAHLNLDGIMMQDINSLEGLTGLTSLKFLSLSGCGLTDLAGMDSFGLLTDLNLHGNPELSDVRILAALEDLVGLDLGRIPMESVSAFPGLADLDRLEGLGLDNCGLKDISGLSTFSLLQLLDLSGNPGLRDIRTLGLLGNLKTLGLNSIGVEALSDIRGLEDLTSLTVLSLQDNGLQNIDALKDFQVIEALQLAGNMIDDISALGGKPRLSYLSLDSHTYLKNLRFANELGCEIEVRMP